MFPSSFPHDPGTAFPLVSNSGRRPCFTARVASNVRQESPQSGGGFAPQFTSRSSRWRAARQFGASGRARCGDQTVIPFIHIGGYRFASYGIMMATGMFVAYYVLRADLRRRQLALPALNLIIAICGSGFIASKLYLALEFPSRYLLHPSNLLHPSGYAFYGGVFGGIGAIFLLARRYRISALSLFDAVSAAGALGYGFGRVGCFLAGDGDYGMPTTLPWGMAFPHGLIPTLQRVHPTPVYEVIGAVLITIYLWRLGRPGIRRGHEPGMIFAEYLVWTGLARFLVEFIRLNVRVAWGLSNAQCVALCSIAGGLALIAMATIRQRRRGQRIADQESWSHASRIGEIRT